MYGISAYTWASTVWVITDHAHPVRLVSGARLIELDGAAGLLVRLSADLPADRQRAASMVRQRLKDGGAEVQRHMAATYQGITDAWSLGITKIPAVIVDRHYVVYGVSDVDRAISLIQDYRSRHR